MEEFGHYDEALALSTKGKWSDYYRGEKKIDIGALHALNQEVTEQVQKEK
ncbi:MAG: hypothetical protein HC819_16815 [Cyclobacteriaceae bacterium]|nr:hypothetical protein [Cyclobacteriaceae bacterium]